MTAPDLSRRSFLETSSLAAACVTASAGITAVSVRAAAADPNSRIRIGFIGPGGRGF